MSLLISHSLDDLRKTSFIHTYWILPACIAMLLQNVERPVRSILGDPGAASREDRMFVVKVYYTNILSSRLAAPRSPRMSML